MLFVQTPGPFNSKTFAIITVDAIQIVFLNLWVVSLHSDIPLKKQKKIMNRFNCFKIDIQVHHLLCLHYIFISILNDFLSESMLPIKPGVKPSRQSFNYRSLRTIASFQIHNAFFRPQTQSHCCARIRKQHQVNRILRRPYIVFPVRQAQKYIILLS